MFLFCRRCDYDPNHCAAHVSFFNEFCFAGGVTLFLFTNGVTMFRAIMQPMFYRCDNVLTHHATRVSGGTGVTMFLTSCIPCFTGGVTMFRPIMQPMTISQYTHEDKICELYSSSWVIFQPGIIIDAKIGKPHFTC